MRLPTTMPRSAASKASAQGTSGVADLLLRGIVKGKTRLRLLTAGGVRCRLAFGDVHGVPVRAEVRVLSNSAPELPRVAELADAAVDVGVLHQGILVMHGDEVVQAHHGPVVRRRRRMALGHRSRPVL